MSNLETKITFRVRPEEREHLEQEAKKVDVTGKKFSSLSDYIRACMLERSGYHSAMIKHQLTELSYEIHKIGVNINQIAKKTNAGYGTLNDVNTIKDNQKKIEELLEAVKEKVDESWQSQS